MLIPLLAPDELASKIEHTVLKPVSIKEIEKVCYETLKYCFRACVVPPFYIKEAKKILRKASLTVTVVDFPLGHQPLDVKENMTRHALEDGADEVDIVFNISMFKSHKYEYILEEITKLCELVHDYGCKIKVIVETPLLTPEEIFKATELVERGKADFIKTSTGFLGGKTSLRDVYLIKKASRNLKIKAAGGIRHYIDAVMLLRLGADTIGTSTGPRIVEELKNLLSTTTNVE